MTTLSADQYQERAQLLYKLIAPYIDKPYCPNIETSACVQISIREGYHAFVADFLRNNLNCDVTYGKDRFGKRNGYLVVSLNNARLNHTGVYQAALVLHKLGTDVGV